MSLLDELKERGFPVDQTKATVQCKVFKDNSGAIEIATNHKWHLWKSTSIVASTTFGPTSHIAFPSNISLRTRNLLIS